MAKQVDLMQGTLEMLILKAVSLGKLHGRSGWSVGNLEIILVR